MLGLLQADQVHQARHVTGLAVVTCYPSHEHGRQVLEDGVDDGTRTHDDRDHNPGLYQLSYAHHSAAL